MVPAAKRVGADLLEFAVPENADVFSKSKKIKTAAKSVGRQTVRKQLGRGSRKKSASRVFPTKSAKQTGRFYMFVKTNIFTNISH